MDDTNYREILESKRLDIIQHLQIDRTFVFDYLRHKDVLDGEDCELIHSEKTTSGKIGKFVDVLARKGANAYRHLLESLQLEHPVLYEKLTGDEADATTSPIFMKLKRSFIGDGGPLVNSELEILTRHLERTYGDLHEMSRRFEQVVQRKKDIEEQLETTTTDLEREKETVVFLQRKIDTQKASTMPMNENGGRWSQYVQHFDSMRKEISDRDIYIIALQTNLMTAREEIEVFRKKNENLHIKNDELNEIVKEMNESYQRKKCESLRLSERIERQGNEIKNAEETMRKYRECQFHNMRLREEKEHLQEELDELTKWTEALKTRYDIVEYEKKKTQNDHTVIMENYGTLQEELMQCMEELNEGQMVSADLRDRVRHLEQDRQTYKKQRDGAYTARREAILDRDKAFLERDQAIRKYNELKECQDGGIEKKILQLKSYDEVVARCDVVEEEVKQTKIKLRQAERQLQDLKVNYEIDNGTGRESVHGKENSKEKSPEINVTTVTKIETQGNSSSGNSMKLSSNTILQSIKRRVAPVSPKFTTPTTPPIFSSSPTYIGAPPFPHRDSMLLEHTPVCVAPAMTSIFPGSRATNNPPKEQKGVGLDRNGATRTPIKMRQNGSDASFPKSPNGTLQPPSVQFQEGDDTNSIKGRGASLDSEGHEEVEINDDVNQSSRPSNDSKVVNYL